MSETPRTEKLINEGSALSLAGFLVAIGEHARTLERENTTLREERDKAIRQECIAWERHAEKDRAYQAALQERDGASAEIERWRDSNIRIRDEMEKQAQRANAAEYAHAEWRANAEKLARTLRDILFVQIKDGWLPSQVRSEIEQQIAEFDRLKKEAT